MLSKVLNIAKAPRRVLFSYFKKTFCPTKMLILAKAIEGSCQKPSCYWFINHYSKLIYPKFLRLKLYEFCFMKEFNTVRINRI